jgi:hypothetical protein
MQGTYTNSGANKNKFITMMMISIIKCLVLAKESILRDIKIEKSIYG